MKLETQYQHDRWEGLVEEYNEAKREFDEAARDLEKARCEKEDYLAQLMFGVT